jgi:imidazolonepropionase
MTDLLLRNIGLLVTPQSADRDLQQRRVHEIAGAAILIQDGRIAHLGPEAEVIARAPKGIPGLDAKGRMALPGFVDSHTHPVFVSNRAAEFHLRNAGKTYLEIAAAGGGIQTSARKVREASVETIIEESLPRFDRALRCGTTTMEAKSGYGLDWTGERKLLDALAEIERLVPQRIYKTFLVHALPESHADRRAEFVREVAEQMIPSVAEQNLAAFVDVFCETGAFTVDESRSILRTAEKCNLGRMVHANQFGHSGGAYLAAEVGAVSAHHLEYLDENEMQAMAKAGVVAVALPASVFFLGNLPYPPARKMIEFGLRMAIATDMNPGSSMTESMPFCMTAAAIYCKMSPAELLWASTLDGARALEADDKFGSLEAGKAADVVLWDLPNLESLSYHFGELRAAQVFIGGKTMWQDPHASLRY